MFHSLQFWQSHSHISLTFIPSQYVCVCELVTIVKAGIILGGKPKITSNLTRLCLTNMIYIHLNRKIKHSGDYTVCNKRDFTRFLLIFRVFLIKQRYAQKPRIVSLYNVCTRLCAIHTHITELRDRIKSDGKE